MNLRKFLEETEKHVTGYTALPRVQRKQAGTTYYDLPVKEDIIKLQELGKGDLVALYIEKKTGENTTLSRRLSGASTGLKTYLPRNAVKELDLQEDDLLQIFIYKKD